MAAQHSTHAAGPADRRVALVTGASGGIGAAVAERLGAAGMAVAVHYAGRREAAQQTADRVAAAGGHALLVAADVTDAQQVADLFDAVQDRYGGVDVVVHTAGIMRLAPLAELDLDDLDQMLRTNLHGAFVVSQQAARRVRRGGAIVHFSSSVVRLALPTYAGYAATKGAIDALVPILARELRGREVTVNAVAPGPTATPLFLDGKDDQTVSRLASMPPLERLGTPEDIAEVVAFLAGPGRWVNGQVLYANGGAA